MYSSQTKSGAQVLEFLTTSSSINTENDVFFVKPGASRAVSIVALRLQGKAPALTALSGLSLRIKAWTGSASTTSGATSVTPAPKNNLVPAAVATAGITSTATSSVTVGTTASYVGIATCGASGPGGWVSINPDDVPMLDGNASKSMDLVSTGATASLNFEYEVNMVEG